MLHHEPHASLLGVPDHAWPKLQCNAMHAGAGCSSRSSGCMPTRCYSFAHTPADMISSPSLLTMTILLYP